jgi:hypothetical protein
MKTIALILTFMNGSTLLVPVNNSTSFNDCDKKFTEITYSKIVKNYSGRKQLATFYKGNEVFMYQCIWE